MVDIKFHCDEKSNFIGNSSTRAFTYTDYSIEMHNHIFYEVNIVLSGSGTHSIESSSFRVTPGDVFVIPPMIAHSYTDTKNLEVYHILFKKSFIEDNKEETKNVKGFLQLTEIEPFLRCKSSNNFFLHLNSIQLIHFKNELDFIDDNGLYSQQEYSAIRDHCIWKILFWFSLLLNDQLQSNDNYKEQRYKIHIIDALEYIHTHYDEKITIDMLSKKAYLSRSTFLRAFKNICGISPIDYLNNYRCEKAKEQLKCNNISKINVAHSCGFYDLSHMDRMLKKNISKITAKRLI